MAPVPAVTPEVRAVQETPAIERPEAEPRVRHTAGRVPAIISTEITGERLSEATIRM